MMDNNNNNNHDCDDDDNGGDDDDDDANCILCTYVICKMGFNVPIIVIEETFSQLPSNQVNLFSKSP